MGSLSLRAMSSRSLVGPGRLQGPSARREEAVPISGVPADEMAT
jgi:hypothetical protein